MSARDPKEPIRFITGFLSAPDDLVRLIAGVKVARNILRQPALQAVVQQELCLVSEMTVAPVCRADSAAWATASS